MQLFTPFAPKPAGLVLLKPIAAKATVLPISSSNGLLRRTNCQSPPWKERRIMGRRSSCPAARTKARDEAEPPPEPQAPAPAKEGEEEAATKRKRGGRSFACQVFESVVLCVWILSWRIGDVIVWNAQDALKKLRGYVLDKFNQKR